MKKREYNESVGILCLAILFAVIIALTHPAQAIISFDEGFHGGAVLYLRTAISQYIFNQDVIPSAVSLQRQFSNGIVLYPPLWTLVAGAISYLFGATTETFRFATSLFYVGAIVTTYWFARLIKHSPKAALVASVILATMPMVVIYSHLMMLEMPQLLGIMAMVTSVYLLVMGHLPRNHWSVACIALIFLLGPLTKLPAFVVAWGTIFGFAIASSLLFYRQHFYKRWLKPELLLFFVVSFVSIAGFIIFEKKVWGSNMIDFYLGQSQGSDQSGFLLHTVDLVRRTIGFYLKDFYHTPVLSLVWWGSLLALLFIKRTPLALFLFTWAAVTYLAFTGVKPQVAQYIMPLYAPLAIATGIVIANLSDRFKTAAMRSFGALAITAIIVFTQILALPKSEAYGWRTKLTAQSQAAQYIADHSRTGERVLSWHDGTIYALRAARPDLQIVHGIPQQCVSAMNQNLEWAIIVSNEPPAPSQLDMTTLTTSPWEKVATFGSENQTTVYQNKKITTPTVLWPAEQEKTRAITDTNLNSQPTLILKSSDTQPSLWGCLRLLPYGKQSADFLIKPLSIPSELADDKTALRLEYSSYPKGEQFQIDVTVGKLRQNPGYTLYSLPINHRETGLPGEFRVWVDSPITVQLGSLTLTPPQP